jgi:hypothetical protein
MLPYLYSLFYEVNQKGGTVIRSLMHEYIYLYLYLLKLIVRNDKIKKGFQLIQEL